ncbi:MAG: DUF3667 domain-containing protein [Chryseobacterium sp.]|nr:DUF3667 domain-containing protein [Chryseobacterium sp.]
MTNTHCLNCHKALTDRYCSGCGQKADTSRITFRKFFYHDLLHGTFHIEKGMLFTAKESLLHPGRAALDYIAGKRKRYYNVFLLILIMIGVMIFIRHVDGLFNPHKIVVQNVFPNEASEKLNQIIAQKTFIFLFVPFAALNSFLLFRRKNLYLSEHFIVSGMLLLGILLIGTFTNLIFHLQFIIELNFSLLSWLATSFILLYIGYGYYTTFGKDYSLPGFLYRIVLFFGLICVELAALIFLIFGFLTDWKFGTLMFAPFG